MLRQPIDGEVAHARPGGRQALQGNSGMLAFGQAEGADESLKALNFILAAWEEGTESGIAPELMAYAALYTALTDLVAAFGEDSVISLVNGLVPRVEKGEFTLYRSRQ
jgi:hypothetical protein